ncbi:MAG: quaternary ammonium compound efflux SMR transporter SugE [Opitutaceae bacterium]|nr:quaternary ammonium compound efflux SMR transporter SugE [Opitutaceae bacterium]
MKAWLILLLAAAFEIVWAAGLKSTHGFTRLWPSIGVIAAMAASMWLLAVAARTLPIGTAYAVWTGIGAVGTAIAGILWFNESASVLRLFCICLIIVGITGLKLASK